MTESKNQLESTQLSNQIDSEKKKNQQIFHKIVTLKHILNILNMKKIQKENILKNKTSLCIHDFGCIEHIFKLTIKNFLLGYSINSFIKFLKLLMKPKNLKKLKKLQEVFISGESFIFGLFPMVYTFILKISHCGIRKYFNTENGYNAFISGFLAGFISLLIKPKNGRSAWAVFLLARGVDCLYQSMLKKNGYSKYFKYDYMIYFALLNTLTGYAYAAEPTLISRGLFNFYYQQANQDLMDKAMCHMWVNQQNIKLAGLGALPIDPQKFFLIKFK